MPVAPDFDGYAKKVAAELAGQGSVPGPMLSDERMNAKIRERPGRRRSPTCSVVGAKEAEEGAVAVRLRDGTQLGALKIRSSRPGPWAKSRPRRWTCEDGGGRRGGLAEATSTRAGRARHPRRRPSSPPSAPSCPWWPWPP
ncbi:MAG: His/Gly/Thr/Pro-type tRNA ligase C-terminal domain-containing protein [Candidatus Moduliflexus flocculans]|nr:His/Gly/Thr/Pro-type tRNA ligase C-terminal domain-containing protein [Candidatus Moduliflexus flocculans]